MTRERRKNQTNQFLVDRVVDSAIHYRRHQQQPQQQQYGGYCPVIRVLCLDCMSSSTCFTPSEKLVVPRYLFHIDCFGIVVNSVFVIAARSLALIMASLVGQGIALGRARPWETMDCDNGLSNYSLGTLYYGDRCIASCSGESFDGRIHHNITQQSYSSTKRSG